MRLADIRRNDKGIFLKEKVYQLFGSMNNLKDQTFTCIKIENYTISIVIQKKYIIISIYNIFLSSTIIVLTLVYQPINDKHYIIDDDKTIIDTFLEYRLRDLIDYCKCLDFAKKIISE